MSIEQMAERMIIRSLELEATDIHVTPRKYDYLIQLRIHGILTSMNKIPPKAGERLISHLKFMASMDISERRKPQSGSFHMHVHSMPVSLRISTLPTANSKESLVIRILSQKLTFLFDHLSLFPSAASRLKSLVVLSHGMLIFTGPTGSGKTTTMYSLGEYVRHALNRNVITLEDPVERQNDAFLQVQVNEKAGITYSTGLKAILRHDPDVIIVGEIRDEETAHIAVRAAMTGHLVLSSLHTRDAKGAIYRLLEFGVKLQDLKQTLIGVSAQRLISLICPICGQSCSPFCRYTSRPKRASVYEILEGSDLNSAIEEADGKGGEFCYTKLKDLIRKGIALGYISADEYNRWIIEADRGAFLA